MSYSPSTIGTTPVGMSYSPSIIGTTPVGSSMGPRPGLWRGSSLGCTPRWDPEGLTGLAWLAGRMGPPGRGSTRLLRRDMVQDRSDGFTLVRRAAGCGLRRHSRRAPCHTSPAAVGIAVSGDQDITGWDPSAPLTDGAAEYHRLGPVRPFNRRRCRMGATGQRPSFNASMQ